MSDDSIKLDGSGMQMRNIRLSEALSMLWVKASERMPEKDGRYLVTEYHPNYKWVGVASVRQGKFDMDVLAWQELPEAYKDD